MTKHDPRGSIWRKWDLHFHTPASFDYKNKSLTAHELVNSLVSAGVAAVAVTDHHTMDPDLIMEMQRLGAGTLTVFPGIELRSQLGGSNHVHYIGIFPEDTNCRELWSVLRAKLDILPQDVAARGGDERFYVEIEKACPIISGLNGIVTIHAGRKSNGIEELSNADVVKQAVKKDLAFNHIHAMEVGHPEDVASYRDIVFPEIDKVLPLLLCSDCHDSSDYSVRSPMWIKADPNFLGLRRVLQEPETRLYLGAEPEVLSRVRHKPTKYFTGIGFGNPSSQPASHGWFSGELAFNPGLIAVIGNKGSGKSALADCIALLCNSTAYPHFSFLSPDRFLARKTNFGSSYAATLTWANDQRMSRTLADSIDANAPELVKYIPQSYLEVICSELEASGDTQFDQELREVIYSHVDDVDRLGCRTLSDLLAYLTAEKETRIDHLKLDLGRINGEIENLEDMYSVDYRKSLEAQLEQRRVELTALDANRPAEVLKPEQNPQALESMKTISDGIAALNARADAITASIQQREQALRSAAARIASASRLLDRVENLERAISGFFADSTEDEQTLGIDLHKLVAVAVDRAPIERIRDESEVIRRTTRTALSPDVDDSLERQLRDLNVELESLRSELAGPAREYQQYVHEVEQWNSARDEIIGSEFEPSTIMGLETRIARLVNLPAQIDNMKAERFQIVREVFASKQELLDEYRKLYQPVQDFIDRHPISQQSDALQFSAAINEDGLADQFLDFIHQGRIGSFQGEDEGHEVLRIEVESSDFSSAEGVEAFLKRIQWLLQHNHRDGKEYPTEVRAQLRRNLTPRQVYDSLYGLDYLKPRFELTWQGKSLGKLSPGERGTLLLVFYLLIDKRDVPLIIDQPEENLDNQTIATLLVPAIKYAKTMRQIMLVTHNPNLAVVCDADQIIHAEIDKSDNNRITYTSGAIENPPVTKLIVNVLEGTKPAFDLRDATYELIDLLR